MLQRRTPNPTVVLLPPSDKCTVCAQYEHLTSKGSYAGDLSAIPPQIACIVRHPLVVAKIVVLARQQGVYKGADCHSLTDSDENCLIRARMRAGHVVRGKLKD